MANQFKMVILLLSLVIQGRTFNGWVNDALFHFSQLCGPQLCNENSDVNSEHTALSQVCPRCNCGQECLKTNNCCPDILLRYPQRECDDAVMYNPYIDSSYPMGKSYKIVKTCPSNMSKELQMKCMEHRNISERMKAMPVSSLDTYLTYDNKHCAECHNDTYNMESWYLDFECLKDVDFNVMNSLEEIMQLALDSSCIIKTASQYFVETCSQQQVVISNCNQTETWVIRNEAIERACISLDQPFGMFKNIFCYICNPPTGNMNIISSCPAIENVYSEPCRNGALDRIAYPYKNKFCYLCNINDTTDIINDIHYDIDITSAHFVYYIFSLHCKDGFTISAFDQNNTSALDKNITETSTATNTVDNTEDLTVPFYRTWQYEIVCPRLEVFSLFSTVGHLKSAAENANCIFKETAQSYSIKYLQNQHLIRECNKTESVQYVNPLVQTACLSSEHNALIAYKGYYNVFCYICNEEADLNMICYNEKFLSLINVKLFDCMFYPTNDYDIRNTVCSICMSPGYAGVGGYRSMFTLSTYSESIRDEESDMCSTRQVYDKTKKICRDLKCGPGKMLSNGKCIPTLQITGGLRYIFAVGIYVTMLSNPSGKAGTDILKILMYETFHYINMKLNNSMMEDGTAFIITDTSCTRIQTFNFSGYLYLGIATVGFVNRLQIEKSLIQLLNSTFNINKNQVHMKAALFKDQESFHAPTLYHSLIFSNKCLLKSVTHPVGYSASYRINGLLLCTQVEITDSEFTYESQQRIHLNNNGFVLGSNDFMLMPGNKVRICADKFLKITSELKENSEDFAIFILETICSIISLACLLLTLVTYVLFVTLRTVPGNNNMTLVIALILNNIVYQVRLFDIKGDNIKCQVMGVLQHYTFLVVFTAFNVCTFHVHRVFCGNYSTNTSSNFAIICKYRVYVFILPAIIIASNITVTYIATDYEIIGYGGSICFLSLKIAAIVTLLCPIGLILLSNLLMFVLTIRHICNSPHISSDNTSRDKRNDLVIYLKLFTITGCSWILQIIDSVLPGSIFSVLIYFCNLLTGAFIFISYTCNMRVVKLYRQRFCGYDDKQITGMTKSQNNTDTHTYNTTVQKQTTEQEDTDKRCNYNCNTHNTRF